MSNLSTEEFAAAVDALARAESYDEDEAEINTPILRKLIAAARGALNKDTDK